MHEEPPEFLELVLVLSRYSNLYLVLQFKDSALKCCCSLPLLIAEKTKCLLFFNIGCTHANKVALINEFAP